ncbi:MAG: tRNA dihydrouridine synthase [Kiritimatiellia bacterium]
MREGGRRPQFVMNLHALRIGSLLIDPPVALAPMAGLSDTSFRVICRHYGCGLVFTEVANAEGIIRGMKRTLHLLECDSAERPIAAHIYGSDPERLAAAAVKIENMGRFDLLDINCGCPVRRILAKGCGAALIRQPCRIEAIVKAISSATKLPVTIKTRIGFDEKPTQIVEVVRAAERGGASAITVHCRTVGARHGGPVLWDLLACVKKQCSIPVIGNGGICAAQDAIRMFEETGVDGVMIGRAAIGNPWIFSQVMTLIQGQVPLELSPAQRRAVIWEHFERLVRQKEKERKYRRRCSLSAETAAAMQFRTHLLKYLAGVRGVGLFRRNLEQIRSGADIRRVLDELLPKAQSGP